VFRAPAQYTARGLPVDFPRLGFPRPPWPRSTSLKKKITATLVKDITPREKPYDIRDTDLTGFLLRVGRQQPSGEFSLVYFVDYRRPDGRRTRYKLGTASKLSAAQARALAEQKLASVTQGRDPQAEKKQARAEAERTRLNTLRVFLEERYGPWVTVERKSGAESVARIRLNFEHLMDRPLNQIQPAEIDTWRAKAKAAGKKPATLNRDIAALKAALSKAVKWELIDVHPLARVRPSRIDHDAPPRYLSAEEEDDLRRALRERDQEKREERARMNAWLAERHQPLLPDLLDHTYVDHLEPMVLFSMNTGLRQGELFNLAWRDVELTPGSARITVRGSQAKSGRTRHVPLSEEGVTVFSAWKKQSPSTEGLVFPGKEGKPFTDVKTSWRRLLERAGLKGFRWHDFRHHFASWCVMSGIDLYTVQQFLGHGSSQMTQRYAHLAPEHGQAAIAKLAQRRAG